MIGQSRHDRLLHDGENVLVKSPADAQACHHVEKTVDDSPPQFLQMIEETHAAHLFRGALLGGFEYKTGHGYSPPTGLASDADGSIGAIAGFGGSAPDRGIDTNS